MSSPAIETSYRFQFNDAQLELLKSNSISFMKYADKYIIGESDFTKVLQCLGVHDNNDYTLSHTEADGLIDVNVHIRERRPAPSPTTTVNISTWNGATDNAFKEKFVSIAKTFSEAIGKNVSIISTRGIVSAYHKGTPDTFYIHIWATPEFSNKERNVQLPSKIFDHTVDCFDNAFGCSGIGTPIESEGYCVAEVFDNDMYIFHNIVVRNSQYAINIFEEITKRAVVARQKYIESKNDSFKVFIDGPTTPFFENIKEVIESENLVNLFGKSIVIKGNEKLFTGNPLVGDNYLELIFPTTHKQEYISFKCDNILGYKLQPSNYLLNSDALFDIGILNGSSDDVIATVTANRLNVLVVGILSKQKNFVYKLLLEYKRVLDMSAQDRQEYDARCRDNISKVSIDSFVAVLQESRSNILKEHRDTVKQHQDKIAKCQKDIVDMTRQLSQSMIVVDALEKDDSWVRKKVEAEFKTMRKNKNILRLEIIGNKLHALTRIIYAKNPDTNKYHEIGAFNITMELRRGGELVIFKNLTRIVDAYEKGMQAPHVFHRGNPCLGSVSETLPTLIGNCEYGVALDLCIQFLQSVNTADSAGKHIEKWPLADHLNAKTVCAEATV